MKRLTILCFAICLAFVSVSEAQKQAAAKPFTTSGYYGEIEMTSKESGDYGGTLVYLTESDGQMFALVTIAAGVSLPPVLVEAKVSGKDMRTVEFTLPNENGDRKFKGTIAANGLTLGESGSKSVLKRKCGGTYSNISVGSGGDYGGMEVFLTESDGTWYVLVTVAEGVLMRPVLVETNAKLDKDYALESFAFTLPGDNGGRKFNGKLTKTGMTLNEGGTQIVLKDKCYK